MSKFCQQLHGAHTWPHFGEVCTPRVPKCLSNFSCDTAHQSTFGDRNGLFCVACEISSVLFEWSSSEDVVHFCAIFLCLPVSLCNLFWTSWIEFSSLASSQRLTNAWLSSSSRLRTCAPSTFGPDFAAFTVLIRFVKHPCATGAASLSLIHSCQCWISHGVAVPGLPALHARFSTSSSICDRIQGGPSMSWHPCLASVLVLSTE